MKSIFNKILLFLICWLSASHAFSQVTDNKSIASGVRSDSTRVLDTIKTDTLKKKYRISKDAITSVVKYGAVDSNFTDIEVKEVHLYGQAFTDYETIKLKADYIVFNFDKNEVSAFKARDTLPRIVEKPSFQDGETKAGFSEMRYNFESHKAIVKTLTTQESEFFLVGETSKYVGKENDTLSNEDKFFNQNAIITTCNHPTPHFGIRARKMKFIPDKIAVMGPAQLEIAGIPTPIVLPFGFFPLIKGQSSGLIFPSDFPYDNNYGFGLRGVGYYFPINDYMDAKVTGDFWTRGSHAIRVSTQYKKRYSYTGNVEVTYANNILENSKGVPVSNKSFGLRVSHSQDSKAHPYRTLSGSINLETNRNTQRNNYDYNSITNNKLTSNFSYSYKWPESPFSFRASFAHNQDNRLRVVNITLPDARLDMTSVQPFKRKNATGDPLWYENITVTYNAGFRNMVKTTDTTLFTRATLEKIETGFSHQATVNTSSRILKYFSVTPQLLYQEVYFLKTLEKTFDPTWVLDTIDLGPDSEGNPSTDIRVLKYGTVNQDLAKGFEAFRKLNASVSLSTNIFGIYTKNTGFFRGIRHLMKPTISLNLSPDTELRYRKFVTTTSEPGKTAGEYYNPFATGPFAQSLADEQFGLNFTIGNTLEMKYRGKKDTVDKKVSLVNNFDILFNYNFARDTLKWSNFDLGGTSNLFRGLSNLQYRAVFTPYEINYKTGARYDQFLVNRANNKKLFQLINLSVGLNTGFTFSQLKNLFRKKIDDPANKSEKSETKYSKASMTTLFDELRFSHSLAFTMSKTKNGTDTLFLSVHSFNIVGNIPLSKNWKFIIGSISYDLLAKSLVYPSFGFSRDLHCWNMNFAWHPNTGVYTFFIGVKSGALNFLKYDYQQPYIPRI